MTRLSAAARSRGRAEMLMPGVTAALMLGAFLIVLGAVLIARPTSAAAQRPDHVAIVIMENHSYEQIIGNASAPYINGLAQQNASLTQSFAIGHPSEPNYLELWSGSNQGVTDDSCPHTHTTGSLGTQLLNAGLSIIGFSLPVSGDFEIGRGLRINRSISLTSLL